MQIIVLYIHTRYNRSTNHIAWSATPRCIKKDGFSTATCIIDNLYMRISDWKSQPTLRLHHTKTKVYQKQRSVAKLLHIIFQFNKQYSQYRIKINLKISILNFQA